ncbi:helix-turn-helix domain-containing protein [Actinoplanes sp. NPDC004185]
MGSHFENAVVRAVEMMRSNMGEPVTVDDMARAAMFSKFHFTRIFQRVTGISPGRFLSAMRLQEAKDLLLSTSMNVADISVHVGYNSVGTFSSRFTRSVGLPPTEYRRSRGVSPMVLSGEPEEHGCERSEGVVSGYISVPSSAEVDVTFIGLFHTWVPEGRPVRCAIQRGSGRFILDKVPDGIWYLLCQGVVKDAPAVDPDTMNPPALRVGSFGPIRIHDGNAVHANVRLRTARVYDPPLLLALPDARTVTPIRPHRQHAGLVGRAA